ncbi:MAG: methylated-DNA--[protein]-cysteine S-methyltransferase [Bacteroidota bacterium]|nr:methylated-DNA--[protein]-cysteine S-methyltransferase [Bacteroidota bacterium]
MNGLGYYTSPVGILQITSLNDKITGVQFVDDERSESNVTPVIGQCIRELEEYFLRGRKFFDVELLLTGSEFQNKVWNELLTIQYGKTTSYLQVAIGIGDINSVRAVGLANGQNPIAIIVPCHRVIGKDGELVGYGGGMDKKLWLLQHEGAFAEQLSLFGT